WADTVLRHRASGLVAQSRELVTNPGRRRVPPTEACPGGPLRRCLAQLRLAQPLDKCRLERGCREGQRLQLMTVRPPRPSPRRRVAGVALERVDAGAMGGPLLWRA